MDKRSSKRSKWMPIALLAGSLGLIPAQALADSIIFPCACSDAVSILSGSGPDLGQLLHFEVITEGSSETRLSFFNYNIAFTPGLPEVAISFTEPGSPSVISDILMMTVGGTLVGGVPMTNLDFSFISDSTGTGLPSSLLAGFALTPSVVEGATFDFSGLQNVTNLLFPTLSHAPLDVSVFSAPSSVPEPATLLLLGYSLIGLEFWRRKKAV